MLRNAIGVLFFSVFIFNPPSIAKTKKSESLGSSILSYEQLMSMKPEQQQAYILKLRKVFLDLSKNSATSVAIDQINILENVFGPKSYLFFATYLKNSLAANAGSSSGTSQDTNRLIAEAQRQIAEYDKHNRGTLAEDEKKSKNELIAEMAKLESIRDIQVKIEDLRSDSAPDPNNKMALELFEKQKDLETARQKPASDFLVKDGVAPSSSAPSVAGAAISEDEYERIMKIGYAERTPAQKKAVADYEHNDFVNNPSPNAPNSVSNFATSGAGSRQAKDKLASDREKSRSELPCLYAGTFIDRVGHGTCKGKSEVDKDFIGIEDKAKKCPEGKILCNPLIYGLKVGKDEAKPADPKAKKPEGAKTATEVICVSPGGGATAACNKESEKANSKDSAIKLIRENKEKWNDFRKKAEAFISFEYKDTLSKTLKAKGVTDKITDERLKDLKITQDALRSKLKKINESLNPEDRVSIPEEKATSAK